MRQAVSAWMVAESGNTIRANNPWNMTLGAASETGIKTCGSWTSTSSGLTFAAFCSPQDGARASARLLLNAGHDWRGYDKVVAAARRGNAVDFLNAIARSAWDGGRSTTKGHYGMVNGGANKLIGIFTKLGPADAQVALQDATNYTGNAEAQAGKSALGSISDLGAWDNLIVFPKGHTLTAADVDYILATLSANGYFNNDPGGAAQSVTRAILTRHIGQAWDKTLQDQLAKEFGTAATNAVPQPLQGLSSVAGAMAQILAALFDPRKWLLVLALIAGAALTAYGGANVLSAAR